MDIASLEASNRHIYKLLYYAAYINRRTSIMTHLNAKTIHLMSRKRRKEPLAYQKHI